jgi:uncharacterized protein
MYLSKYVVSTDDKFGNLLLANTLSSFIYRLNGYAGLERAELLNLLSKSRKKHLFLDQGFLIKEAADEWREVQELYEELVLKRNRLELDIFTSNTCNFNCSYCFQPKSSHSVNEAQYESILQFIEYKMNHYRNLTVHWFGGEPLLRLKEIIAFSERAKAICRSKRKSYVATMGTNAYLLDLETFDALYKCNVLDYQITLDGLEEVHNKNRPLVNGKGSFATVLANLRAIRDKVGYRGFHITIRINFTRELMERGDEIVHFLQAEFGNDRRFNFRFAPVQDWSGQQAGDEKKLKKIAKKLVTRREVSELMVASADKLDFNASAELRVASNNCWAASAHQFVFNGDGKILKCDFYQNNMEDNLIGSLPEPGGQLQIDRHRNAKWEFDSPMESCHNCTVFPICLSLLCGAARLEGRIDAMCEEKREAYKYFLEAESYQRYSTVKDIVV